MCERGAFSAKNGIWYISSLPLTLKGISLFIWDKTFVYFFSPLLIRIFSGVSRGIRLLIYVNRPALCRQKHFYTLRCIFFFFSELFSGKSCLEWLKRGYTSSGVYNVPSRKRIDDPRVYCDMITDGGGWMVILRRVNNDSLNFDRTWNKYIFSFGDLLGSYWHGLGNLKRFTDHGRFSRQELRVDLEDWDGNTAFAKYSTFRVAPEEDLFRLTVDGYSGTAGDGLSSSNGMAFTSKDSDNDMNVDNNCAVQAWGGWWFKNCFQAFCNGRFSNLVWAPWKGFNYALKKCEMKIRPIT